MNPKKRMLLIFVCAAVLILLVSVCIYFAVRSNQGGEAPEVSQTPMVSSDGERPGDSDKTEEEEGASSETKPSEGEEEGAGPSENTPSPSPSGNGEPSPTGSEPSVSTIPPIAPNAGSQKYTEEETRYLLNAREMAQKVNHANEKTQKLLDSFSPGEETAASFEALAAEFGALKKELSGFGVPKKFQSAHQALLEAVGAFQNAASLFVKVARDRDVEALKEAEAAVEAGNSKIREGSALLSSY